MIKRISMWRLRDRSVAIDMKDRLLSMSGKVPSLIDIEVGINESEHPSSFDIVFIGTFLNPAAVKEFENDAYHLEVGEFVNGVKLERKVVEFSC